MKNAPTLYPTPKDAILLTILWIALHASIYLLGSYMIHTFQLDFHLFTSIFYLLGSLSALPVILLSINKIKKKEPGFINMDLTITEFKDLGRPIIFVLCLILIGIPLNKPSGFFEDLFNGRIVVISLKQIESSPAAILNWIHIVVLAPVFEEYFFRGILLNQFSKRYPRIKALLISSVLFAAAHFTLEGSILLFVSGMVFGIIYINSNSIIIPIITHSLVNLYHFYFTTQTNDLNSLNFIILPGVIISFGIIITAIFFPGFLAFSKKDHSKKY